MQANDVSRFCQLVNVIPLLPAGFIGGVNLRQGFIQLVHRRLAGETLNRFPGHGLLFLILSGRLVKAGAAAAKAGYENNEDTTFHVYENTLNTV
jgi:hypothetical protein